VKVINQINTAPPIVILCTGLERAALAPQFRCGTNKEGAETRTTLLVHLPYSIWDPPGSELPGGNYWCSINSSYAFFLAMMLFRFLLTRDILGLGHSGYVPGHPIVDHHVRRCVLADLALHFVPGPLVGSKVVRNAKKATDGINIRPRTATDGVLLNGNLNFIGIR